MAEVDNISEIIEEVSPHYASKKKKKADSVPAQEHQLVYDSTSETLEPVYFWILDFMDSQFDVEKLVDNFTSSPGGGHFAEIGARATRMQEEGMKIMGAINTVIKSIINLIYDLKEFQIRLEDYNAANSEDKEKADAGLLALKQRWMDTVDIKRGRGSINMLAQDLQFVTLRDAFMAARKVEEVDKMDLNDRVKRLLKPRLSEFLEWKKRSETELKKRFEIERNYLKSQVNSLKLYTRWAKPYFIAAEKLRVREAGREPEIVNVFNTLLLELTILGKKKIDVQEAAIDKNIPEEFKKLKLKRDYYYCVLVDFVFRGIPQRVAQQPHFAFGGKVEVSFKGYCLNEDELKMLNEKLGESDIEDALRLIEGATSASLDELREDIENFIEGEEKAAEEQEKKESEDVNPFSALLGIEKKQKSKSKDKKKDKEEKRLEILKEKGVSKDSYTESVIRKFGEGKAAGSCFNVFDVYKKAHGMASHPNPFD